MNSNGRNYSLFDNFIISADTAVKTIFGGHAAARAVPKSDIEQEFLSATERALSTGLMRVNHVGEVCAQALYQGQGLSCKNKDTTIKLEHAALEEIDHLAWLEHRLLQLEGRTSYLNPVWYTGSFVIGYIAGLCGDEVNLGFLAETEHQVSYHLEEYINKLPLADTSSRVILQQMLQDEIEHADMAISSGGVELPLIVKQVMKVLADAMKKVAYII